MNLRIPRLGALVAAGFACAGCSSGDAEVPTPAATMHVGGQTGGEAGLRCSADQTVTPLAFDAPSPLGFSASDVETALPARAARPLAWTDGSSAVLDIELTFTTSAGYASSCHSNAADVTITLQSSDGALGETLDGRLFSAAVDRGTLDVSIPLDQLRGTLGAVHPTLVERASGVSVLVDFDGNMASGRILALDSEGDVEIAAF